MNWFRAQWKERGTQLLGLLMALAACAAAIADDILEVTPQQYKPFAKLFLVVLAYFVARRGSQNQRNINEP